MIQRPVSLKRYRSFFSLCIPSGCSRYQVCGAYPSHKPICVVCVIYGSLFVSIRVHSWFFVYLSPCPEVPVPGTIPYRDSCPKVSMHISWPGTFPICPVPGGLHANLFCVPRAFVYTGGLRARRAHASERRMCITVGASPGGRRTYGPETPTSPRPEGGTSGSK